MYSLTWSVFIGLFILHVIILTKASSSSSEDSHSSEGSSSKEKRAPESSQPKTVMSLDGSAVSSQNAVPSQNVIQPQPPEKLTMESSTGALTSSPTTEPVPATTVKPLKPKPSSLSGTSFVIGLLVGFIVVGTVFAGIRLWMRYQAQRRLPYTIY